MKFLKVFLVFFIIILLPHQVFAEENKVYSKLTVNNLTFTSYSKSWTEEKLKALYTELLNNFHGDEFDYLKDIYIYPNSPEGVNAHYNDGVSIQNGAYVFEKNASISLFNGDKYDTVPKIANILSHEYGHHYIIFNLLKSENIYYHNLSSSKYITLRNLKDKPVVYNETANNYLYHWDIMELMADDYVQLLGSSYSKTSYDYKSVDELLNENKKLYTKASYFNANPQLNPLLPLAADIDGLYNYFLSLGGFAVAKPKIPEKPVLNPITVSRALNGEPTYNINWKNPNTTETFEYTLVIYPDNNPFVPYALKTISSKEPLNVTFGSYSTKDSKGVVKSISQKYEGKYTLKLYMKNSKRFLYASNPVTYDFTKLAEDLKKQEQTIPKPNTTNKPAPAPKPTNTNKPSTNKPKPTTNNSNVIGPKPTGSLNSAFSSFK